VLLPLTYKESVRESKEKQEGFYLAMRHRVYMIEKKNKRDFSSVVRHTKEIL